MAHVVDVPPPLCLCSGNISFYQELVRFAIHREKEARGRQAKIEFSNRFIACLAQLSSAQLRLRQLWFYWGGMEEAAKAVYRVPPTGGEGGEGVSGFDQEEKSVQIPLRNLIERRERKAVYFLAAEREEKKFTLSLSFSDITGIGLLHFKIELCTYSIRVQETGPIC